MANKYNDILTLVNAGNNMGLSNTIKRDYGIPLDFTSVQETYDAAVIYAATSTLAYVGQTVAVGGKLYIISDTANGTHTVGEGEDAKTYDNYLAEVGSKTEGDGNTIELDGQTLKLAGLTGLDNSKTYVPSLVNGKLVWAEPDTSTAEGQAQEITALKTRTAELEATVNGVEASEGVEAKEGLVGKVSAIEESVSDEVAAREAADTVLEGKIAEALQAAKDYADENDADTIYNDAEVRGLISDNATAISGVEDRVGDVEDRVADLEAAVEDVNTAIAGITHFTTEVVASTDDVTKTGVLYLIKDESVTGSDKYNEYLFIEGQGAVLIGDTTTDLSNYVTTEALNAAIADFVTSEGLASAIAGKADQTAVDEALALKANAADVVANETFNAFKTANDTAIADARSGAVADVEAKGYAVATDVNAELEKKIETGSIAHTTEETAEGVTVDGTALNIVVDAFTKAETRQYVADTISQMTGGESAADVLLALNNYKSDNDERVGAIETKNSDQDTAITAAQTQADKGVADAKKVSDDLAALVSSDITPIKSRLTTLEEAKGNHESRIATAEGKITALEEADANFTSDLAGVSTTVAGHTTTIGEHSTKLTELAAKDSALETKIDANTAKFADYSTTTEVENAIDAKIAAIPAVDLTDYAKSADVEATYAKIGDAYTKDEADAAFMTQDQVDDRLNALINAADPEGGKTITDVQNLVKYVEENAGEIAALVTATDANTAKLAGIETTVTAYVNDALAAMIQPKASDEISVAEDGTLGIVRMNVNKLVQTEGDELVLNGGNA